MSLEDCTFDATQFRGTARLFPLPNLVVFPHVMQPLHIFEPCYLQMFEEAIETDQLIAMAVLSPGWEHDYEGRPPIRSTACLCRVATHHKTEQGTYNALLLGVSRIKILRELPAAKTFREAHATLIDDVYSGPAASQRPPLQKRLVEAFRCVLPKLPGHPEELEQMLSSNISLGMLTDIIAYTLNLKQTIKEQLLSQPRPDARAMLLLKCLTPAQRATGQLSFPPQFSTN